MQEYKFLSALFQSKLFYTILTILCLTVAILPFIPEIQYQIRKKMEVPYEEEDIFLDEGEERSIKIKQEYESGRLKGNVLVIPTIGVYIDIVEGNSEKVLSKGAWRRPNTSTPDRGGNTVITAHRYYYIPPNNKTFYNLDKLEIGSKVFIYWQEKEYIYEVYETLIVKPQQLEIEENTEDNILTLYTCHPFFTANKRYVVKSFLTETKRYL